MFITTENIINLCFITFGIAVCLLNILLISVTRGRIEKQTRRYFQGFFMLILIYICSHLARQFLEGNTASYAIASAKIATFIEFVISGFMVNAFSILVVYEATKSDVQKQKKMLSVFGVIIALHLAIIILAQFNNHIYYFDSNNFYHRGNAYIVSNFAHFAFLITDIYFLLRYRVRYKKNIKIALWIYIILPILAIALQSINNKVQFIIFATIIASLGMYAIIMTELTQQYVKQNTERARMETELNMASNIQTKMLPHIYPAFPEVEEFDIYASMNPAKEVGGDFYDYFLLDDDNLGIVMADVSGKGVPAALFMMISKTLLENYALIHKDPKATLEAVNNQICKNNPEDMFVTVWLGILNIKTGKLTAVNAGHEYPFVKRHDGDFEPFQDNHGFVIGGMQGVSYKPYEIDMEADSKLFLYTDGLPEATNGKGVRFGTERMVRAIRAAQGLTAREMLENISGTVNKFVNGSEQFDDLTMLCLHYKGKK